MLISNCILFNSIHKKDNKLKMNPIDLVILTIMKGYLDEAAANSKSGTLVKERNAKTL